MQKHSQQFHNIFVHISSFSYGSYNKVLSRIPFIYSRVRVLTEGPVNVLSRTVAFVALNQTMGTVTPSYIKTQVNYRDDGTIIVRSKARVVVNLIALSYALKPYLF